MHTVTGHINAPMRKPVCVLLLLLLQLLGLTRWGGVMMNSALIDELLPHDPHPTTDQLVSLCNTDGFCLRSRWDTIIREPHGYR